MHILELFLKTEVDYSGNQSPWGKKCRINKKCQIKMENLPPTSNFRGSRRVKVQEETRISSTVFFFPLYFPLRAFSKMSLTFRFPFAAGISRSCSRWWQDLWAQCNQDGSLCHSGSPQGQRWSAERQAPGLGTAGAEAALRLLAAAERGASPSLRFSSH